MRFPSILPQPFYLCQVFADEPGFRMPSGQHFTDANLATKPGKDLQSITRPNDNGCRQMQEQYRHMSLDRSAVCMENNQVIKRRVRHVACPQCARMFVSESAVAEHVKNQHQNMARYRCEFCGKGYSRVSHYNDHCATHTGVKRNVCSVCLKQFTFKSGLKAHVLRFHPNETAQI